MNDVALDVRLAVGSLTSPLLMSVGVHRETAPRPGRRLAIGSSDGQHPGTEEGRIMHARVSTYEGPPGQTDEEVEEITRRQEEGVLPTVRQPGRVQGSDRSPG